MSTGFAWRNPAWPRAYKKGRSIAAAASPHERGRALYPHDPVQDHAAQHAVLEAQAEAQDGPEQTTVHVLELGIRQRAHVEGLLRLYCDRLLRLCDLRIHVVTPSLRFRLLTMSSA
jgi:hypothetical protein